MIHTVLFYFMATNLLNLPLYVFFLWILMTFNSIWLYIQAKVTALSFLKRKDPFLINWINLNSITAAFVFTSFFPYPYIVNKDYIMTDDLVSNLCLLIVLTLRSILDYHFAWDPLYKQGISLNK